MHIFILLQVFISFLQPVSEGIEYILFPLFTLFISYFIKTLAVQIKNVNFIVDLIQCPWS